MKPIWSYPSLCVRDLINDEVLWGLLISQQYMVKIDAQFSDNYQIDLFFEKVSTYGVGSW